ncbi:MAG: response regulator transcription factor [Planctomycetaceae bacterium]|nr:response regulator transcription factor [Planctomycetaceae bacterium]
MAGIDSETLVKKKVLVVDDHPVTRRAIASLLDATEDLVLSGEAADVTGALKAIEAYHPDVVIVDMRLRDSNGIDLLKDIHVRWPKLPVLVFSMRDESFFAERTLRAGARGYVSKTRDPEELIEGIHSVLGGGMYVSSELAEAMVEKFVESPNAAAGTSLASRLSDREYEVFELIGEGLPMSELAKRLHISIKTVESHRDHIKKKLKVGSSTELLKMAIEWVQSRGGG